jgi:hypothetical protein
MLIKMQAKGSNLSFAALQRLRLQIHLLGKMRPAFSPKNLYYSIN